MNSTLSIREAVVADTATILGFIKELADYEKAAHEVVTTVAELEVELFAEKSPVEVLIAEIDNKPVGFALFFHNFSTWLGKKGIYLEDLYVQPGHRGHGVGKALLKKIAQIAVERNCGRVEWSVLDWNQPAIDFYKSIKSTPMDEWTVYRLTGKNLADFAR